MSDYQGVYLPKQTAATNVAKPKLGQWDNEQGRAVLANLAKGLDIGDRPSTANISSIPDVYARPLLFQSAFSNAGHPLHGRVVQEWRGLLSLLALHRVKNGLKLTFTPVDLSGGDKATPADKFVSALTRLAPPPVRLQPAAPTYHWTDLLLIQLDGPANSKITLGALSPTSLVFTAADYDLRPGGKILPFIGPFLDDDGYLRAPSAAKNRDDLHGVGEWVSWLIEESSPRLITEQQGSGRDFATVNRFDKALKAWRKDIQDELETADLDAQRYAPGRAKTADNPTDDMERVPGAAFLDDRGIYRLLLTPLQLAANAEGGVKPDCALALDQRRDGPYQHVVVIHRDLSAGLRLWGDTTMESLGTNPIGTLFRQPSGHLIGSHDIGPDRSIWIRPELYFLTATLTKAAGPVPFLTDTEGRTNGNNSRYLLPLRPELLKYFTVAEIREKLKPRYSEDGDRVTFSLTLPLTNGRELLLTKTFLAKGANAAAGEGVLVERAVPVLEVFPNYLGEFWARYYLLCSDTETLHAVPVHEGPHKPAYRTKQQQADTSTEQLRAEITRISGADCFPEAVALSERKTQEAVGLVLLEKYNGYAEGDLQAGSAFNGKAVFGIDFGTSNTNVFVRHGEGESATANVVTLEFPKLLRPLTAAPTKLRDDTTQAFFIPTKKDTEHKGNIKLPTPTALRVYNAGVREDLLLDYFIYFPDRPRYPENVLVDLKWEQESRLSLNNFLEALCFLLVAQAVRQRIGTIEFRCTYPKSFSPDRILEYKTRWNATLQGIFDVSGSLAAQPAGNMLLYGGQPTDYKWLTSNDYTALRTSAGSFSVAKQTFFNTEGVAAGEYFSNRLTAGLDQASPETGAICIDVGGGTTDFSILFKRVIKYDASVLLAGRQIAEAMAHNDRIGEVLFSNDAREALQQAKAAPKKYASRMNFILKQDHKSISAKLAQAAGSDEVRPLRRVLMVEFGALAFYAGHLALALNRFLKGDLSAKVANSGLKLHWGGNASKMLDWIDSGHFDAEGNGAAKLLNNLFGGVVTNKEVDEADRLALRGSLLGQVQSKGQKDEAAGGIVVVSTKLPRKAVEDDDAFETGDDDGLAAPDTLEGLVMGEQVTIGERSYPPHYAFSKKEVDGFFDQHGSRYTDTSLQQLDQFLKVLNHLGVKYGGLNPGELIELSAQDRLKIRNYLRTEFAMQADKEPNERMIEPIFIMEVRYLLDLMLHRMTR